MPASASAGRSGGWVTETIEIEATAIGVSWEEGVEPGEVWVRASEDGTDWGPWVEVETHNEEHGPDPSPGEGQTVRPASDPVYVGRASRIQFRGTGLASDLQAEWVETAGRTMELMEKIGFLISRLTWGEDEPAIASPDAPNIVSRAEWGGDACIGQDPHKLGKADRVQMMFVHHTVHGGDANSYSPAESKDLVYAICSYHVNVREFWDIAYNFLIDRYGTIYEGRGGGIESTTIGGHTAGFNSYSTGVAFVGAHNTVTPSPAAQTALANLAAWKLDVHHIDPNGYVTLKSLGSTRYEEDVPATFRTISGHRDASTTSCPGAAAYALIDGVRRAVAGIGLPKFYGGWSAAEPIEGLPSIGYDVTPFPIHFTEPMTWTIVIRDQAGTELVRFQGAGTDAAPTWDGTYQGERLPVADYYVEVNATPSSGGTPQRPGRYTFQLGSYYPPFADDDDSVHRHDIAFINSVGISEGCGNANYCPHQPVRRWEMAVLLVRTWEALGLSVPDTIEHGFTDISEVPRSGRLAINTLAQLGITAGKTATEFDPFGEVSRSEMALFLMKLWEGTGLVSMPDGQFDLFTDIDNLNPYTQTAIRQLADLRITSGTSETTYDPLLTVSREHMASFLARLLEGQGYISEAP